MDHMDKNPQIQPMGGKPSTENLLTKEPAELAEDLERLLDNMTETTYDADVIDAYLALLEEKAPAPQMKDPKNAYEDLRKRLRRLAFEEKAEYKPRKYAGWKRYAVAVAATVCLTLALMVGAQATGTDVFGRLARWTSETFSFVSTQGKSEEPEYLTEFREELEQHEIPTELTPTWVPEGFQTDGPMYDEGNPFCDSVGLHFTHDDGREFTVWVDCYFSPEDIGEGIFEKDAANVELYTSHERTFYIFSNINTITAAWSDETYVVTIGGDLSVDEVKRIIDSIGR